MKTRTLTTVLGAALVSSLSGTAVSAQNPFAATELESGYLKVAEADKASKEMVCGEGKCGGSMTKTPQMNCGAMKADAEKKAQEQTKMNEMKCAGMKMDGGAPAAPKTP